MGEVDAYVFPCLGDRYGCRRLMSEIRRKPGFLPGATWLIAVPGGLCRDRPGGDGPRADRRDPERGRDPVVPRAWDWAGPWSAGRSRGSARPGLQRAYLEVTAENAAAVRLYRERRLPPGQDALQGGRRLNAASVIWVPDWPVLGPAARNEVAAPHDGSIRLIRRAMPAQADPADRGARVRRDSIHDRATHLSERAGAARRDDAGRAVGGVHAALAGGGGVRGGRRPGSGRRRGDDGGGVDHARGGRARQPRAARRRWTTWASATRESAQTLHTSLAAATLGRNLEPALEIFADMVLRPHLDDDEVEPIRALCLQNLRSLEDDPGTKVIYELRRRHFPDPWGRPSPGTPEGVAALTPDDLRRFLRATYRPNGAILGVAGAIDWPRLRDAVGPALRRLEAPARAARSASGPPGRAAIISSARPSRSRSPWPTPRRPSPAPTTTGPRRRGDPGRLFLGPAVHRGPREARAVLLGLRQLRGPARPRRHALLRRHLRRPGAADPRRDARRDRPPGPRRRRPRGAGDHASGPEELADHGPGIEHEPLGLARLRLVLPGRVRPLDEIAAELDALTPESVSDYAGRLRNPAT